MMSLFLALPLLQPLSDSFMRYLTLVQPKVEDSFSEFADANANALVFVDVRILLNSIVASRSRATFEAEAKMSYLNA
jgi:hypothetical protein